MRFGFVRLILVAGIVSWLIPGWLAGGLFPEGQQPLGQHCHDVGPVPLPDPIPADWCGCTWGAVFYEGQPVTGAQVTIEFQGQALQASTVEAPAECFPYFGLHGEELGMSRSDVFTVTAVYAGQTISRTVRALPDALGEQQANLVFAPDPLPEWNHYGGSGLVRALALPGDALWSGGDDGAARYTQPYACATLYDQAVLPSADVWAIAPGGGSLWVGTAAGLSEFDGQGWIAHDPGLASSEIRAVAVAPADGTVYAGAYGYDGGGVSRYDGTWQPLPDVNGSRANTIKALLVAEYGSGPLWVGSEEGLSHCSADGTACLTYTTDDGLGSNHVTALAEAQDGDLWVASWSYVSPEGQRGGASRYDTASGTWHWYTPADGLAAWDVADVAVDGLGRVWFATWGGGVSLLDGRTAPGTWTTYTTADGLPSNNVRSLAIDPAGIVWAGTDAGLYRFPDAAQATTPLPIVDGIAPNPAIRNDLVAFSGHAAADEDDVLAYAWHSSLDGPLGTTPAFEVAAATLAAGTHHVTLAVQDPQGRWSEDAEATLLVEDVWQVYLPFVAR